MCSQVAGVVRFRDKVYQLVTTRTAIGGDIKDNETLKLMHKTIKKVQPHHQPFVTYSRSGPSEIGSAIDFSLYCEARLQFNSHPTHSRSSCFVSPPPPFATR